MKYTMIKKSTFIYVYQKYNFFTNSEFVYSKVPGNPDLKIGLSIFKFLFKFVILPFSKIKGKQYIFLFKRVSTMLLKCIRHFQNSTTSI